MTDNTESNNYFTKTNFGNNFNGKYTCDYKITNDTLILGNKKQDYKDLKSNTIFRSVLTDNIDPNNREQTGKLGDNWMNDKGIAVRSLIKQKENHENVNNDTYNPLNLEYSFTLTPTIIQKVKLYNDEYDRDYDDFNLTCTSDGRECISEFLTELSEGKVSGEKAINNYSSINNWGNDDLEKIRKKWKYYIGETNADSLGCTEINNTNIAICNKGVMTLEKYNKLYEMWGVLP